MIYRIEFDRAYELVNTNTDICAVSEVLGDWFSERMAAEGLRVPKTNINPRTRFWFTEYGWKMVGKKIAADMNKVGAYVRIKKRKNPKRSDVYWCDPYQVALLPKRKGKK